MHPETRFVRSGGVDIAYQVVGEGPADLVVMIGWISHPPESLGPRQLKGVRGAWEVCRLASEADAPVATRTPA